MVKINCIIFPLSLVMFYACVQNKNTKAEIERLKSRSITLPKTLEIYHNGKRIENEVFVSDNLKLINYTSSSSCTSCVFDKIAMWDSLTNYAIKNNKELSFYFIFNPKSEKYKEFKFELKRSLFDYPLLLDSLGEFERLNPHLPKNKAMHTFLLDEDNNVILVGNPLTNKNIEKMFYEEVEKRLK